MFLNLDPWDARNLERELRDGRSDLSHWIPKFIEDHKAYVALAQDVARGLHRARQRLVAGDTYFRGLLERGDLEGLQHALAPSVAHFDRLLCQLMLIAARPWPDKILCPHCGAPPIMATGDTEPGGDSPIYTPVHVHPDGRRCRGR